MKISLITVCYNAEKTIADAMASVARQKGVGIEYVVVDVNNFEPVTFDELLANNNAFQRRHADTAKANPFDLYCAEA